MLSRSGRSSPPNPLGVGILTSPRGFNLVMVFVPLEQVECPIIVFINAVKKPPKIASYS